MAARPARDAGLTMPLFKMLGILVGLYATYAALSGKVYARSGPGGRMVTRRSRHDTSGSWS